MVDSDEMEAKNEAANGYMQRLHESVIHCGSFFFGFSQSLLLLFCIFFSLQ